MILHGRVPMPGVSVVLCLLSVEGVQSGVCLTNVCIECTGVSHEHGQGCNGF